MIDSVLLAIVVSLIGGVIGFFSLLGVVYSLGENSIRGVVLSFIGMLVGFSGTGYALISILFKIIEVIKA